MVVWLLAVKVVEGEGLLALGQGLDWSICIYITLGLCSHIPAAKQIPKLVQSAHLHSILCIVQTLPHNL